MKPNDEDLATAAASPTGAPREPADAEAVDRAPGQPRGTLPPAALRALAEAEERRRRADVQTPAPREIGGRDGPDPVRFGDWERNGLASDF